MAGWEYISKRRRMTLQKFLDGIETLEAAKLHFKDRGISPPTDGSLEDFYKKRRATETSKQSVVSKKSAQPAKKLATTVEELTSDEVAIPGYPKGKKPKKQVSKSASKKKTKET